MQMELEHEHLSNRSREIGMGLPGRLRADHWGMRMRRPVCIQMIHIQRGLGDNPLFLLPVLPHTDPFESGRKLEQHNGTLRDQGRGWR